MASRNLALVAACQRGLLPMVKSLYSIDKEKVDPSAPQDEYGNTTLHIAAYYGKLEVVKYLITEKHCDPMCKARDGATPLHHAISTGRLHIVKYLIDEQQVDPSCRDEHGDTPLHKALRKCHFDIARYLIDEQQVDLSYQNKDGDTPLYIAVQAVQCASHFYIRSQRLEMVKYLIDKQQVDLSYQNKSGNTIFHIAAQGQLLDLVKCLPYKKCRDILLNCRNRNEKTPLDLAVTRGSEAVLMFFNESECVIQSWAWE